MKLILILLFTLIPIFVSASIASDFIVNPQPTYNVPPSITNLLILDLTLPGIGLTSIKINNAGTVQQYNLSRLSIYEDGSSPGWDGDEVEIIRKSFSPFFDTELKGSFSKQRIFVAVDISSTTYSGKTIKPEIQMNSAEFSKYSFNGPTDEKITGFERTILAGTDIPYTPVAPLAKSGEAISTSIIRWHFTDLSNNEFGFKILDGNLKTVAEGGASISYLDETELEPDTEYSGRQVVVFNDRGKSSASTLTVFPAVKTLSLSVVGETRSPEEVVEPQEEPPASAEATAGEGGPISPEEDLRAKIQEIQLKVIELLNQLIQLLQEQASKAQAGLFEAFESFTNWLELRL